MKWAGSTSKVEAEIHPHTPQFIISSTASSNLLLGYINVTVNRPTPIRSIHVAFSGVYSVCWVDGMNPARDEFYQQKMFHCDKVTLSGRDLAAVTKTRSFVDNAHSMSERDLENGWEEVSYDSSSNSSSNDSDQGPPRYSRSATNRTLSRRENPEEFVLYPGTHRFEFFFIVPQRMPSSIVSNMGGIEYKLSMYVRAKGSLGMPISTRASCPVQLINIPTRFAQLQSNLPVNDEAIFTRQIEESWWILVRVSSCTVCPEDVMNMTVCLSWPAMCDYDDNVQKHLELLGVQMDLCESTLHRSMVTGNVLKSDLTTVATSLNGNDTRLTNNPADSPPSYDEAEATVPRPIPKLTKEHESSNCQLADTVEYVDEGREHAASARVTRTVRGMFNEGQKQVFQLKVPKHRNMNPDSKRVDGIHIDCRAAPISVNHKLQIRLQVLDKVKQKLHLVPFHCRVVIIPEVESFLLPAYASAQQDTLVQ
ncbi:hypothetical protein GGF46_001782 [Coemansia sp. RSA 552]|nr:hypothetical protein GGF46_001782 [Coemansia sp. RSA 552]